MQKNMLGRVARAALAAAVAVCLVGPASEREARAGIGSPQVLDDAFDFDKFVDAMTLDAPVSITGTGANTLAITTANWSISAAGVFAMGAVTVTDLTATGNVTMNDAGADTILIGAAADTVTIASNTLSLTDDNWSIGTDGAARFLSLASGVDNAALFTTNIPVTGVDAGPHTIRWQIDGNTGLALTATGDGAGGVGARTVEVGVSAAADIVTIGDGNADVSITDAQWNVSAAGAPTFGGLITGSAGATINGAALTANAGLTETGAVSITGATTLNPVGAVATDDQIAITPTAGGAARFAATITNADLTAARTLTVADQTGSIVLAPATGPILFAGPTAARTLTVADAADTLMELGQAQTSTAAKTFRGASPLIVDTATATDDRLLVTAAAGGAARFDATLSSADLTVGNQTFLLPNLAAAASDTLAVLGTAQTYTAAKTFSAAGGISVTGGSVTLQNSETLDTAVDASFRLTRNDAGTVTLTAADNDATAALTILPGGAAALVLGGGSTTSITLTTDGTGTGEVVLPDDAISASEITNITRGITLPLASGISNTAGAPTPLGDATNPGLSFINSGVVVDWSAGQTNYWSTTIRLPPDYIASPALEMGVTKNAETGANLERMACSTSINGAGDSGDGALTTVTGTAYQVISVAIPGAPVAGDSYAIRCHQTVGGSDDTVRVHSIEFRYLASE